MLLSKRRCFPELPFPRKHSRQSFGWPAEAWAPCPRSNDRCRDLCFRRPEIFGGIARLTFCRRDPFSLRSEEPADERIGDE